MPKKQPANSKQKSKKKPESVKKENLLVSPWFTQFLTNWLYKKAPAMSDKSKDILLKILPYLFIFTSIFSLLRFTALSLALINMFKDNDLLNAFNFSMLALFLFIQFLYATISAPKLFKAQKKGWEYAYYSSLAGLFVSLTGLTIFNIFGSIIQLYILFQVKEKYK